MKEAKTEERKCEFCGNRFTVVVKPGYPTLYCSNECRRQKKNQDNRVRMALQRAQRQGTPKVVKQKEDKPAKAPRIRQTSSKKHPVPKGIQHITEMQMEAKAAGMTYGQYMSMLDQQKEREEREARYGSKNRIRPFH